MITEAIVQVAMGFFGWLGTLFQGWSKPDWAEDASSQIATIVDGAQGLGVWFPFNVLSVVVASILTLYLIAFGTKFLLKVAAFLPFIGGSG